MHRFRESTIRELEEADFSFALKTSNGVGKGLVKEIVDHSAEMENFKNARLRTWQLRRSSRRRHSQRANGSHLRCSWCAVSVFFSLSHSPLEYTLLVFFPVFSNFARLIFSFNDLDFECFIPSRHTNSHVEQSRYGNHPH
jgi:hypothetical protein